MPTKLLIMACLCCSIAPTLGQLSPDLKRYRAIESYELRMGILATPTYSTGGQLCELIIQSSHYSNKVVNLDGSLAKTQILLLFDELVPPKERGAPGLKLPEGTEIGQVDGRVRTNHILYEDVSLAMYGKAESENFVFAKITWKRQGCG